MTSSDQSALHNQQCALLTHVEVGLLLRAQRAAADDTAQRQKAAGVEPERKTAEHYAVQRFSTQVQNFFEALSRQRPRGFEECDDDEKQRRVRCVAAALRRLGLTPPEIVEIINMCPRHGVDVFMLVKDADARVPADSNQEEWFAEIMATTAWLWEGVPATPADSADADDDAADNHNNNNHNNNNNNNSSNNNSNNNDAAIAKDGSVDDENTAAAAAAASSSAGSSPLSSPSSLRRSRTRKSTADASAADDERANVTNSVDSDTSTRSSSRSKRGRK